MKKFVIASLVVGTALGASSAAYADHVPVGQTFDTRGQCQAAIAQARNDARRDSSQKGGEYNKEFKNGNFFCEENDDGTFTIVNGPDRT
jgi:hypothetical protein